MLRLCYGGSAHAGKPQQGAAEDKKPAQQRAGKAKDVGPVVHCHNPGSNERDATCEAEHDVANRPAKSNDPTSRQQEGQRQDEQATMPVTGPTINKPERGTVSATTATDSGTTTPSRGAEMEPPNIRSQAQ